MIDPADVRALLEAYDSTDQWCSDVENLINGLRDLLPRDYPADMLGMWAEHAVYGRVLVCSAKPDSDGEVYVTWGGGIAGEAAYINPSKLTFPEQHPETLTTLEDCENAPEGTVVATDGSHAWTKRRGMWRSPGGSCSDAGLRQGKHLRVLRWGWIQ